MKKEFISWKSKISKEKNKKEYTGMTIDEAESALLWSLSPYINSFTRDLPSNYAFNVFQIRLHNDQLKTELVEKLNMIDYKRKLILSQLKTFSNEIPEEIIKLTDKELDENRIYKEKGQVEKVTGIIKKAIKKQNEWANTQFLDYFHKLRRKDDEYYITGDPIQISEAYQKVKTCVSPEGDNAANMFYFMFSPYTYIAYNKYKTVRMLIHADYEAKVVFLNPIYGEYDKMFELSIINHYIKNGFYFINNILKYFQRDSIPYMDSYRFSYENSFQGVFENAVFYEEELEAGNYIEEAKKLAVSLIAQKNYIVEEDLITGNPLYMHMEEYTIKGLNSAYQRIMYDDEYYCYQCGNIVDEEHFDFDYEECHDCAGVYLFCEDCGDSFHKDHGYYVENQDKHICKDCFERHYFACRNCGEIEPIGEAHCSFDGNQMYCEHCVDDIESPEHKTDVKMNIYGYLNTKSSARFWRGSSMTFVPQSIVSQIVDWSTKQEKKADSEASKDFSDALDSVLNLDLDFKEE